MKKNMMRKAIAMIELIFAIVIMGIVMMSAPLLINTATQSGYVAMQQESIAIASSKMGMIMTHEWDEQGTDTNLTTPILLTDSDGVQGLGPVSIGAYNTGKRAGSVNIETQRSFLTTVGPGFSATLPANFTTENDFNDIDDYDDVQSQVRIYAGETTNTQTGFVGDVADAGVRLLSTVEYMDETLDAGSYQGAPGIDTVVYAPFNKAMPPANSTNIKYINVTLTTITPDVEMNKTIRLNAFSCNIGSYALEERSF